MNKERYEILKEAQEVLSKMVKESREKENSLDGMDLALQRLETSVIRACEAEIYTMCLAALHKMIEEA